MSSGVGSRLTHGYQINYIGYLCMIIQSKVGLTKIQHSKLLKNKFHEDVLHFFLIEAKGKISRVGLDVQVPPSRKFLFQWRKVL